MSQANGVIYFIKGLGPHMKIGFTTGKPSNRLVYAKHIAEGFPDCKPHFLTLRATIPGTFALEQELHRILRPYAMKGQREWYIANPLLLALSECAAEDGYLAPHLIRIARVLVDVDRAATEDA